jgi:RNA-binding protein
MEKRLKGSQRQYLRGIAHGLKPVIQIGRNGINPEVISHIDQALTDHELIKIKFNEFKEEKKDLSKEIERETKSELVGTVGHIAIFFRENPEKEKKIILPK